ncbi:MAG: Asp23/Gls24 family envelope stress response protein [Firmicutes bacterium]|nr:Asp23/Gls24 family envelope stress response protein [Bacillota bacterium]
MKTYALIGSSGTGKSHQCAAVAFQEGIEYLIDDGLFIHGSKILAGRSAKREKTKMAAVKRAIFIDPQHARQVRRKIREVKPKSILILATSERMGNYIADRLQIPLPEKIIRIEDVSTRKEIEQALEIREKENRHVIPIPTFAIEKDFPGYLLDPIKAFFMNKSKKSSYQTAERSIVRPLYSSLGNYFLSENVIEQIAVYVTEQIEGVAKAKKNTIVSDNSGIILNLSVTLIYGVNVPRILLEIQEKVKEKIEYLTGSQIKRVNVFARRIVLADEDKTSKKRHV